MSLNMNGKQLSDLENIDLEALFDSLPDEFCNTDIIRVVGFKAPDDEIEILLKTDLKRVRASHDDGKQIIEDLYASKITSLLLELKMITFSRANSITMITYWKKYCTY